MTAGGETKLHNANTRCRCKYCDREVAVESRDWRAYEPFCSGKCRLADLDRWFEGEYIIPGRPFDEEDDNAAGGPQ
jgi:endogenous inhibitor of DNA gyrase (YacG/DUF329 family)